MNKKYLNLSNNLYYNHLINNLEIIHKAKKFIDELDTNYFDLKILNNIENINTSIVMTTYNRSSQTYFTLKSIKNFENVQIILVDDSNKDFLDLNILQKTGICIYYIKIKNKFWFNPCVNYNLGFKFIKGEYIIIQNSEVCHVGNIVKLINENLEENQYFVFDVIALKDSESNKELHSIKDLKYDNYEKICSMMKMWYQHYEFNNRCLHFLTSMKRKTFEKIFCFDYDFCMGSCYDDDEFIFRIINQNINVFCIPNDKVEVFGIHQWHVSATSDWDRKMPMNNELLYFKKKYFEKNKNYFYSTNYNIEDSYKNIINLFKD